jgi:two-component system chemotaxis response regulator CheB
MVQKLVDTVRLMSEVRVIRRWPGRLTPAPGSTVPVPPPVPAAGSGRRPRIIAIGASTGGPLVLQTLLSGLPRQLAVPVLIVQHIAPGFLPGMADWLRQTCGLPVQVAVHGQPLNPGTVYLAPEQAHLGVDAAGRVALSQAPPDDGLRPSVAHLFRSVAGSYGADAVGILLTGMGHDGARELKLLRDTGAITVAQDADSSVVHGMPGEAIKLGGAAYVLPPERMVQLLADLFPVVPLTPERR